MNNNITFCIATAKNEKEYTKLLIRSLRDHTNIDRHEILIFIDSDNQNTYEELLEIKKELPNLKIYRNTEKYPIGSQRNVSILFNAASNDIVCYLQSDMVVGPNFDTNILKNMTDESVVLCLARIEPPLHPPGPEKIVKNFGLTPEEAKDVAEALRTAGVCIKVPWEGGDCPLEPGTASAAFVVASPGKRCRGLIIC
jgi:glycosyltransferase involved in cell wall biosynthesis